MDEERLCSVCARPFIVPHTSRSRTDGPACSLLHAANLRRAWRLANAEKIRAYGCSAAHRQAVAKNRRGEAHGRYLEYQKKYRKSERGRMAQKKYREARRIRLAK